jgi:hypothetical protein
MLSPVQMRRIAAFLDPRNDDEATLTDGAADAYAATLRTWADSLERTEFPSDLLRDMTAEEYMDYEADLDGWKDERWEASR